MAVTWIERHPKWLKVLASPHPAWNTLLVLALTAGLLHWAEWNLAAFGWTGFIWLALGVLGWTLFEYAMHRWIYHGTYKNKRLREFIESFHIYHHRNIQDPRVLTAGVLMILPLSLITLSPLYVAFSLISNNGFVPYAIGFIAAYGFYEWVHYLIHTHPRPSGYLKWITRYHMHHHDRRWDRCFGNTSSLWDHLLGTYSNPAENQAKLQSH